MEFIDRNYEAFLVGLAVIIFAYIVKKIASSTIEIYKISNDIISKSKQIDAKRSYLAKKLARYRDLYIYKSITILIFSLSIGLLCIIAANQVSEIMYYNLSLVVHDKKNSTSLFLPLGITMLNNFGVIGIINGMLIFIRINKVLDIWMQQLEEKHV